MMDRNGQAFMPLNNYVTVKVDSHLTVNVRSYVTVNSYTTIDKNVFFSGNQQRVGDENRGVYRKEDAGQMFNRKRKYFKTQENFCNVKDPNLNYSEPTMKMRKNLMTVHNQQVFRPNQTIPTVSRPKDANCKRGPTVPKSGRLPLGKMIIMSNFILDIFHTQQDV